MFQHGGGCAATARAAAGAPLHSNKCGRTSAAAAQRRQVRRPPRNNMCGGRRATTTGAAATKVSAAATLEQQQGRRPLRVPCSTSIFGGRPLVRPPSCKRNKGSGCRRPTLCCRHRK